MDDGLIRFVQQPRSAWANGLGETVELWRTPAAGAFDMRLSIATVGESGPFSRLPGIDRVLMPLAEGGLALRLDGEVTPVAQYDTIRFAGEADAASVEVTASGYDLNLMVRRGLGRPDLVAHRVHGLRPADVPGLIAVIALDGEVCWAGYTLSFGDTVLGADAVGGVHGHGLVAVAAVA